MPGAAAGSTGPAIYWARETYVPGFTVQPEAGLPGQEAGAGQHRARASRTPSCASEVTPDFEIGCKRILISNTYYPALAADNVDLVTDPIAKVTGNAVVTADGVERPIDVLVVATGFHTTELPIAEHDHGPRRAARSPTPGATTGWRRTRAPPSTASPTCS